MLTVANFWRLLLDFRYGRPCDVSALFFLSFFNTLSPHAVKLKSQRHFVAFETQWKQILKHGWIEQRRNVRRLCSCAVAGNLTVNDAHSVREPSHSGAPTHYASQNRTVTIIVVSTRCEAHVRRFIVLSFFLSLLLYHLTR